MTNQVTFQLRGRNPDILSCIANLSSDEVFTPPELASQMLDMVAESWASNNRGANIWADKSIKFLDPCAKSGVFLREITRRLTEGLANEIPDLRERVDHILTQQVFGIAITQITSLLARRSIYCSKDATGEHSIAESFFEEAGNIWFKRTEHAWTGTKCRFCDAPKAILGRDQDVENYAYPFIHSDDINTWIRQTFGEDMQFDVVIGNPPYQMSNGESSDIPIYQHFVAQAKALEPRYLSMVIPSRWMAGGKWLDDFRREMLADHHIRSLVDFERMSEVFPGVDFEGGACYFLRDSGYSGEALVKSVRDGVVIGPIARRLDEFDVFVRDPMASQILKKVLAAREKSLIEIVSGQTPFGLLTNFKDFHSKQEANDVLVHYSRPGSRGTGFASRSLINKGEELLDHWKVLIPMAFGERGAKPSRVLGWSVIARPNEVCTQTYLAIGPFNLKREAESFETYCRTKFFRFLVSLRKITQHAGRGTYTWVPQQTWDREWIDKDLYKKYKLDKNEIEFIESMIRPMERDSE